MKLYQINYDLRKQRSYESLYERIRGYGTWCHPLESCWLIATNQSAAEVRDNLRAAIDADDGLLVTRMASEAAWYGLTAEASNWLKTQFDRLPA